MDEEEETSPPPPPRATRASTAKEKEKGPKPKPKDNKKDKRYSNISFPEDKQQDSEDKESQSQTPTTTPVGTPTTTPATTPGATPTTTPTTSPTKTGKKKKEEEPEICLSAVTPADVTDESCKTFVFKYEGHTLGNSLRYVISQYPETKFCGHTIPHPSENEMHFRIQTVPEVTAADILRRGLQDLVEVCDHTDAVFAEAFDEYRKENPIEIVPTPPPGSSQDTSGDQDLFQVPATPPPAGSKTSSESEVESESEMDVSSEMDLPAMGEEEDIEIVDLSD